MDQENLCVAISDLFFTAFANLAGVKQKRVAGFVGKFRANPLLPGYNYEKIYDTKDDHFFSVRVDDTYRAVVLKTGNTFVLLWVDHHDAAYYWARTHVSRISDRTGGLSIVRCVEQDGAEGPAAGAAEPAVPSAAEAEPAPAPSVAKPEAVEAVLPVVDWSGVTAEDLSAIGVPEDLHAAVRAVRSSADLPALMDRLESSTYEALNFLADGDPIGEVIDTYRDTIAKDDGTTAATTEGKTPERVETPASEAAEPASVGTDEAADGEAGLEKALRKALDNPYARQRFCVNPNEEELAKALEAPLERWRVFLHPSQRNLVERDWNGPVSVRGGAGTGKTVVALHRAKWLAENRCGADERILFTTFTTTLAEDIRRQLSCICDSGTMRKIEVVNLDKWVSDFLTRKDYGLKVDYLMSSNKPDIWEQAMSVVDADRGFKADMQFFRDEWSCVVQPQEVTTVEEYLKAKRTGRNRPLSRAEKRTIWIWPVFEEYVNLLNEMGLRQPADAMRDARQLLDNDVAAHLTKRPYAAVIVDEGQDMSRQALRLIRALVPEGKNDILIVGDAYQRIYGRPVTLGSAGIRIVGRSRVLRINYRTTEEIRREANRFLGDMVADDLDGADDRHRCVSLTHGRTPRHLTASTGHGLYEAVADEIRNEPELKEENICIVAWTKKELDECAGVLERKDIDVLILTSTTPDDSAMPGVRLTTMHRVKGLEFDKVFLMNTVRTKWWNGDDAFRAAQERSLKYVAASRARKELVICELG